MLLQTTLAAEKHLAEWLTLKYNKKKCRYHDNQSSEDGSRVNSRNVVYTKYTSDYG
jgi:hypothetical protein